MVIIASTLVDVLIAAPLGFLVGLFVGIMAANRFIIVLPRDRYEIKQIHDKED